MHIERTNHDRPLPAEGSGSPRRDESQSAPKPAADRSAGSVSVIVPTYNERENVTRVVEHSLASLDGYDAEVIVVDDDSPDGTWRVAQSYYDDDERVRVVRRTEQRGLATAVSRGFAEATGEYCAVIDADLQHPPSALPRLLSALDDGADIAIGSRYTAGGGIESWSFLRRAVSWGATWLSKAGIPATRGLTDPLSGLFAARRSIVTGVSLSPRGYKILLEILSKCRYERVVEVPYTFLERERGQSKLTAAQYRAFCEHALALSIDSHGIDRLVAPARAVRAIEFGLVGAVGTILNTVVFLTLYDSVGVDYLVAGTGAFLVAVNWNFLGNRSLTFDSSGDLWRTYYRFNAVSVAGFVVYVVALSIALQLLFLPAIAANVVAIGAGFLWNFVGSDTVVFGDVP